VLQPFASFAIYRDGVMGCGISFAGLIRPQKLNHTDRVGYQSIEQLALSDQDSE
jgi:hypothetical protein